MKTKYFFLAAIGALTLASCSSDELAGDNGPTTLSQGTDGSIQFAYTVPNATRADIVGNEAAAKLGNNFYVMGTKGNAETATPSLTRVFDNYLVSYTANTAGKTASNTANWEYVGVTPDGTNYAKLSPANVVNQTIKFWDYSQAQYDFLAFSTGTWKALKTTTPNAASNEIGVTSITSGAALGTEAYKFYLPSTDALGQTYITDIVKVEKSNFGKEVTLQFKNLGSKVRLALYETVPGYSIQASSVKFYSVNGTNDFTDASKEDGNVKLISSDANTFAGAGTVQVKFPNMGTTNLNNSNYNKATATVTGTSGGDTKKSFGALDDNTKATAEGTETAGKIYIGRSLPYATFAGSKAANYYQSVFPISNSYPLTLRVDYTLVSTDGSGETINIYGAKAVIPSNYTVWQPNYAYTYIFKISDNTNGWTSPTASSDATDPGLFPITFDAVVAEATDASGEQTTVSTVATPSIITYQQGHTYKTNEYSKTTKGKDNVVRKLYVQVMHNEGSPEAHPVGSTYATCPCPILNTSTTAFLYKLNDEDATEADVMDALENRTTDLAEANVTGRNGLTLTKNSHISAVSTIVNGVDDNPITIASDHGNAAEIDIANEGVTTGTYAFVYDYSTMEGHPAITEKKFYQPKSVAEASIPNGTRYITKTILDGIATTTTADEAVNSNGFLYFSKTTDGTGTTTYSYYSVDGKETLPAGLLKVAINDSNLPTSSGSVATSTAAFIFDVYTRNNGSYAVKVIKIIA